MRIRPTPFAAAAVAALLCLVVVAAGSVSLAQSVGGSLLLTGQKAGNGFGNSGESRNGINAKSPVIGVDQVQEMSGQTVPSNALDNATANHVLKPGDDGDKSEEYLTKVHLPEPATQQITRNAVAGVIELDEEASRSPEMRPPELVSRPSQSPESMGLGTYSEAVSIKVPAFRGLEPQLSLRYLSSGGLGSDRFRAGWIGVGWGLQGLPDIIRTAPIDGLPRFNANDVYQIDGQDILVCSSGFTSASCLTGGTHATKVESYERIKFENNTWTIWEKNGIRSVFRPVSTWGSTVETGDDNPALIRDSYRWLLSQREDGKGNIVNYSYTCLTLPVCYPSTITYGGAEIRFVSVTHPAYQTKATGRSLAKLERQLKRIEIKFAGQQIRAYALTHETSPSTGLQRLSQVQEYGKDWTASGTSVTGSVLPGKKFAYSSSAVNYIKGSQNLHQADVIDVSYPYEINLYARDFPGDFNGDGRVDVLSSYRVEGVKCRIFIGVSKPGNTIATSLAKFGGASNDIDCWNRPGSGVYDQSQVPNHGIVQGDFNGDGLADFGVFVDRVLEIYLNRFDGTTYNFVQVVTPNLFSTPERSKPLRGIAVGDFDGDGAVEIYSAITSKIHKVVGNTITSTTVTGASYNSGARMTVVPNAFGDGKTAIDKTAGRSGSRYTYDSTTSSFVSRLSYNSPQNNLHELVDVPGTLDGDGDGVSDFLWSNSADLPNGWTTYPLIVGMGTGRGVGALTTHQASIKCPAVITALTPDMDQTANICWSTAGDLDGDGKEEAIVTSYFPNVQPKVYSYRGGNSWIQYELPMLSVGPLVDVNGDGKADILPMQLSGFSVPETFTTGEIYYSTGPIPDLLTKVTLESGGTVDIEYKPSSEWGLTAGTRMPFVTQTVSAITEKDGRGGVARTEYSYRGGRYDFKERKFLGFAGLTAKLPCASGETVCPTVDVTFSQAYAAIGKPVKIERKDGAGVVRQTVVETYAIQNTTAPYTALNTATETTLNDGGSSLVLRTERAFDAYANITQIRDFGRKDLAGDETWTLTSYAPNTTDYIVSLPRATNVRSLTNGVFSTDSDVYQKHQVFYYDSATSDATPPTKGNLTMRRSYKSVEPTSSYYAETFTYDANGNRLSHVDGAGNRTEWDYDATYKLYVVKERAPKYFANGSLAADTRFVTTTTPNFTCGQPASKIDWNGVTETYTYDVFCRPYGYTNSGSGKYINTRYENFGTPTTQAVVTSEALATGAGSVFKRNYYDGLGRAWRVQTPGETATGAARIVDTNYDGRSNAAQVALPRFVGETAQWTVNSYDWQDRVVKTVNPDASQLIYTYAVQPAASVTGSTNLPVIEQRMNNEEGKVSRTYLDKDGNVILTSGNLNNAWVNEVRSYDVVGRLRGVRDHSGAVWTYTYDLIGNRLTASDPDLGAWSYAYDNANRLVSQTDARGVVTTLAYDQMDRLTKKQVKDTAGVTTVLATNTYDTAASGVGAAPFHNVGLLTVSTNGSATQRFSQSLTGTGTVTTTQTEIDGLIQTTTDRKGKAGLTLSRSYAPGAVEVGTVASPWTYNAANMLVTIPGYVTAAAYEADGQTKSIAYANGVATTFTYLPQRDWLTRVTTKKGTVSLLDSQYTRDKLGRIKTITGLTPAENWTYAYDDISRLVTATNAGDASLSETYTYSLTGNLLSRTKMGTYTYPAGNAVRPHAATKIGSKVLSYDANGNMLSDGSRTLTWTPANQLGAVTQSGADVTFSYGPNGSRVKKAWAFGTTLYAGADVEIDATTAGSESYTLYPHPDIKITATASAQTAKFFLHRDHLSSVRTVTNEAGAETEKTAYVSYGEPTNQAMVTKKGYIGERFDAETGLMYLNARYYDPTFGRYIPPDDGGDAEGNTLLEPPIMEPGAMTMGLGGPTGTVTAPLH